MMVNEYFDERGYILKEKVIAFFDKNLQMSLDKKQK